MSEYAKNIQIIEDLWKKRIELREEGGGRMSKMLKISGAWDVWDDEKFEPFEMWLNVDSVIALMPDHNVIVMGGDGAQFTCTPESFERVCKAMGVGE